jgi:hypothetical protein
MSSFKVETIKQSFKTTGIFLMNAEVILHCFTTPPHDENEEEIFESNSDGTSWRDLNNLFHVAVVDTDTVAAEQLSASLHSLQVQNELLNHKTKASPTLSLPKRSTPRRVNHWRYNSSVLQLKKGAQSLNAGGHKTTRRRGRNTQEIGGKGA